jgi:UDP-2,3-diacylglucosamine pyrophosphatase LpxH
MATIKPNPMTPHDQVISALLSILEPLKGELRLLNRLSDPLIRNSSSEVFFFVPDLHLVSAAQAPRYPNYRFNHAGKKLLANLLLKMAQLKKEWEKNKGPKLVTIQVGDFFDLWREFPSKLGKIPPDSHGELRDVLYRGELKGKPCLEAIMILGNHDTKRGKPLPEITFQLKAFNSTPDEQPFLFVSHGDAFSQQEKAPDWLKELVVHFLVKSYKSDTYSVASWSEIAEKHNKPADQMRHSIVAFEHLLQTRDAPLVTPGKDLPERLLHRISQPAQHNRFNEFYSALQFAKDLWAGAQGIRVFALGHSHHANIVLYEPPDKAPMVMLDTGAWIENCQYHTEGGVLAMEPNAQLSVIHGNDIRVYQVSFPALRVPSH